MDTRKTLLEAKATSPEVLEFIERSRKEFHPFTDKFVKNYTKHLAEAIDDTGIGSEPSEGALRGRTISDMVNDQSGMLVAATLEIFNSVIRGFTRYMDDSFAKKYVTNSVVFKVPLVEYQEAISTPTNVQLPHVEKTIDYATVDLSSPESERGGKVSWTRALLEDVTFEVQGEMAEGLGHGVAMRMTRDLLRCLLGFDLADTTAQSTYFGKLAGAAVISTSTAANGGITWAQFLSIIAAVDIGIAVTVSGEANSTYTDYKTYGPADYVLVAADVYWQLLNIIQMTNVLYEGSTDPITAGKIKLALGCTIIKESLLPKGVVIALNSQKAIALVTRRSLKIEPILFPVWNEYGFIGTVRYGCVILFPGAIAIGAPDGVLPTPK